MGRSWCVGWAERAHGGRGLLGKGEKSERANAGEGRAALKGPANQGRESGFYSGCSRKLSEDSNGVWWYDLSFKKSTLVMGGEWIAWWKGDGERTSEGLSQYLFIAESMDFSCVLGGRNTRS